MIDTERARALVEAIWNGKDMDAIEELFAENYVGHDPQNPVRGTAEVRAWVEGTLDVGPDFHINIHEMITSGDVSASRWTASGTQRKEWRGIPPTNKAFVMTGITMSKWDGDKVVESWVNADNLGMLQQLGIVPEMAG